MNDTTGKSSSIFTPSGCLGEDALMRVVNGTMSAKQLELAKKHMHSCPFCSDAAEGLRLWMEENKLNDSPENQSVSATIKQDKPKTPFHNQNGFHARTNVINERIRQRLRAHSRMEDAESKRLSYKPFVWMAAAASIVILIGSFFVVWIQNRNDEQKLADLRARELKRIESASNADTLSITFPEGEVLLAAASANDRKTSVYKNSVSNNYENDIIMDSDDVTGFSADEMNLEIAAAEMSYPDVPTEAKPVTETEVANPEEVVILAYGIRTTDKKSGEMKTQNAPAVPVKAKVLEGTVVRAKEEKELKHDERFVIVEQMPMFPGGEKAMNEFIAENLRFPASATESSISGKVIASFIVKTDGSITDIQILKGLSKEIDDEVLRVISMMPRWKPGEQNGKKLDVKYNLPINISLQH